MFRTRPATSSKSSHNFSPFGVSCQRPLIRARKLAGSPSSHNSASNNSTFTVVAPILRQKAAIFFRFSLTVLPHYWGKTEKRSPPKHGSRSHTPINHERCPAPGTLAMRRSAREHKNDLFYNPISRRPDAS